MQKNLKCSIHKLFMNLEKFHYGSILAQKLKNHIFGPFWVPFGLKTSHQKKSHISQFSSWNKLHFAHTWTFVYMKMFAVHDCAHKNRVLMSSLCTGAKISAKTPLCQAVYKIQIRTNPQCLKSTIATFNSIFFKAIPCKLVRHWVPMSKLQTSFGESSLHVFLFWLWQGHFRTIRKVSTMLESKENYT